MITLLYIILNLTIMSIIEEENFLLLKVFHYLIVTNYNTSKKQLINPNLNHKEIPYLILYLMTL